MTRQKSHHIRSKAELERAEIEDADVVNDFRGDKDAAKMYRKRIKQLKAKLDRAEGKIQELHKQVEFWMSEDDGSTWPPENTAWRKLLNIKKKTPEQLKEMQRLVPIINWKMDERLQYERAEQLQSELATAQAENKRLRDGILAIHDEALGEGSFAIATMCLRTLKKVKP